MFARILVPLDGSAFAEQALTVAEEMARQQGAPLHLIRVVDPNQLDHFGLDKLAGTARLDEKVDGAQTAAGEYLQQTAQALEERGLTVTAEVRRGSPARELIAAALPGDLIVISTHGRHGATRWVIGSVAETVVRGASVPVLLIRAEGIARPADKERVADLLRLDQYRPGELAELLNMDVAVVRQAALTGRLHATIRDHHVISITRADALRWLEERG
jgi:nucleotide-binding universal stress UspA family protein